MATSLLVPDDPVFGGELQLALEARQAPRRTASPEVWVGGFTL